MVLRSAQGQQRHGLLSVLPKQTPQRERDGPDRLPGQDVSERRQVAPPRRRRDGGRFRQHGGGQVGPGLHDACHDQDAHRLPRIPLQQQRQLPPACRRGSLAFVQWRQELLLHGPDRRSAHFQHGACRGRTAAPPAGRAGRRRHARLSADGRQRLVRLAQHRQLQERLPRRPERRPHRRLHAVLDERHHERGPSRLRRRRAGRVGPRRIFRNGRLRRREVDGVLPRARFGTVRGPRPARPLRRRASRRGQLHAGVVLQDRRAGSLRQRHQLLHLPEQLVREDHDQPGQRPPPDPSPPRAGKLPGLQLGRARGRRTVAPLRARVRREPERVRRLSRLRQDRLEDLHAHDGLLDRVLLRRTESDHPGVRRAAR